MKHGIHTLICACLAITSHAYADFTIKDVSKEGHLDVLEDGRLVGRYMYGRDKSTKSLDFDTAKTYLHVFDAEGKAPITKGPGGELPHHRGIFIGWNKLTIDGRTDDLWHMPGSVQLHEKFVDEKTAPTGATFTSLVSWKNKAGDTLLEESRKMTFIKAPAPAYILVDVTTTLTAKKGDVLLDGDPEHAGLQYRPSDELDRSRTRFLFPKEKADPLKKDFDYPWVAESYGLGDKIYNVVYLNHPENPKETRFSAYRDYGRFGAFFKTTIPKNSPLTLKVRFLISEGELPDAAWIQKQWNLYTKLNEPEPKTTLNIVKPSKPAPPK